MMRVRFLFVFSSLFWALTLASAQSDAPPNILLIMTDDQGWGDIHSHGNTDLDTPVLDRLAHEGVRFERFYVSPVCAPTRASLLTGRYHLRTGVHGVTRTRETMRADEVTLAEVFKQAGYATGIFGKWHNGAHYPNDPNGQGFDTFVGFSAGHWNNYFDTGLVRNGEAIETEGYMIDVLTDSALTFIEHHQDEPFFVYVPYNTPHSPFQVPERYFQKYKQRGYNNKDASVYGMVENIDDNVGRLLDRIDALGLEENTIVMFLTDNGPNGQRYNGGMRGTKGSVYEGGTRVPFFMRWTGILPSGTVIRETAAHIDVLPTLVELTGIDMPETKPLDGTSLVPLLNGTTESWPDRMLFSRWNRQVQPAPGAVRTARWRAVHTLQGWELYDMLSDPGQHTDVGELYADTLSWLSQAYADWFADVTADGFDPIPTPVGHAERPTITLPGHEAFLQGDGISYVGASGWANDWVTNWTSTEAYPSWPIDVVEPGEYEVTLMHTAVEEAVGTRVRVEVGDAHVEGGVAEEYNPEPRFSPDREPRGEVYEKTWNPLILGTFQLEPGPATLTVRALELPGGRAMDVKAVRLRKVN